MWTVPWTEFLFVRQIHIPLRPETVLLIFSHAKSHPHSPIVSRSTSKSRNSTNPRTKPLKTAALATKFSILIRSRSSIYHLKMSSPSVLRASQTRPFLDSGLPTLSVMRRACLTLSKHTLTWCATDRSPSLCHRQISRPLCLD